MNVNEIKAIIAEKIAGQGNQVDIGNGLVEVLNALADAISEGGGSTPTVYVTSAAFGGGGVFDIDVTGLPAPKVGDIVRDKNGAEVSLVYVNEDVAGSIVYSIEEGEEESVVHTHPIYFQFVQ